MNQALERLAAELDLSAPAQERLRLAFARECVLRVAHYLEDAEMVDCLAGLGRFLDGGLRRDELDALAARAAEVANHHPGSRSLDGSGHAAVSASYAVANALAGKALQAADYAAYAAVYGGGGYGAVADRASFEPEFAWQVDCLARLSRS
jgi:hypothetical protein